MSYQITREDARSLSIPDASIDLVVTSPPYFGLRSYTDGGGHYEQQIGAEATPAEFVAALLASTREMVRVLRPTGSIWVNLGDKYAGQGKGSGDTSFSGQGARDGNRRSRPGSVRGVAGKSLVGLPWRYALACVDDLGLILRAEVIWSKPNGMPESVTDRVRRSHETWFHFTTQPRYFVGSNIREPYTAPSRKRGRAPNMASPARGGSPTDRGHNPLGKMPGSVRSVPTSPLRVPPELAVQHFAAFPPEWPRWIIEGWCPEGGTVLDPFGGTGTTAMAADVLGRHGISNDLSADYNRVAEWRINDPKQRAKVRKA